MHFLLGFCFFIGLAAAFVCGPARAQALVLGQPTHIATAPSGEVLVFDAPGREVLVFDTRGGLLQRFAVAPPGRSRPFQLRDMTVDRNGRLLLLDRRDNAVHIYDLLGRFQRTQELAPANFAPRFNSITSDAQGRWFVSADGGVLNVFDPSGAFVSGEVVVSLQQGADTPGKLAIDASGQLYAVDRANHSILRLGSDGPATRPLVWRGRIGGCSTGPECQRLPATPAVPQPTVGRTAGWCLDSNRCGNPLPGTGLGRFQSPVHVSATAQGELLVSDFGSGAIQRFDAAGRYIGTLARRGVDVGQTGGADATAVGADGSIYALQTTLGRVSKFSADGVFERVFGGGVVFSIAAVSGVVTGDVPQRPLVFTSFGTAAAQTTAVAVTSLGGYAGAVAFGAPSCSTRATAPLSVPCSQFGLSASLAPATVTVAAGQSASTVLTVTAAAATPDNDYVLALPSATPGLAAYVQVHLRVAQNRRLTIAAAPPAVALLPGDPPARVTLDLASLNVIGTVALSAAFTPPPPAQHLGHRFLPQSSLALSPGAAAQRTLEVTALPDARTGNYTLNVGTTQGATAVAAPLPVAVQVGCDCRSTGDFVRPSVRPVTSTGATTGTSPDGNVLVTVTPPANGLPARLRLARSANASAVLVDTDNPLAWGFSPDSSHFVLVTPGPSSHIQELAVYDLSLANRRVIDTQVLGCPLNALGCQPPPRFCYAGPGMTPGDSCLGPAGGNKKDDFSTGTASWGFGPDSRSFVFAGVNPLVSSSKYKLNLWALKTGLANAPRIVDTEGPTISAFWRYSPCGDLLMVFNQRNAVPSSQDDAGFYFTGNVTTGAAALERANQVVSSGGVVAPGPVGATVVPAFVSNGDFDVRLLNLARAPSSRPPANVSSGFQSPQCQRRP